MSQTLSRIVGAVAIALFAIGGQAQAAGYGSSGGSWGSSGGSSGGYASSGGSSGGYASSGGSYGGSHGRHHGGMFSRWHCHQRVHVQRSHHSSGGSWGWHGSSGGSYGSSGGSYGSSGGSHGYSSQKSWGSSGGSSGGVVYSSPVYSGSVQKYSAPVQKGGVIQKGGAIQSVSPVEGGDLTPPAVESTRYRTNTEATLTVNVPAEAKIFVNGTATRSNGTVRRYVSRGLTPGSEYTYEIKAELERDGQTIEDTKTVQIRAGQTIDVAFDLNAPSAMETVLTVKVPEDAKVYLSGNETAGEGTVRVFRTSKLEKGAEWSDYAVRVSVVRDGKTISREQTLTMKAGDTPSLTFDFDAPQVASR